MEESFESIVVLDNGSSTIRCGFSGDDAPKEVFPNVVGSYKKLKFVGSQATRRRKSSLQLQNPVVEGVVQNWESMEQVWRFAYDKALGLGESGMSESAVLLSESPINPKAKREKTTSIYFESFAVPAFFLQVQSVLSLFASGRHTGCVIDSGFQVTHAVPVYEGFVLPKTVRSMHVGGAHLTKWMRVCLKEDPRCVGDKGDGADLYSMFDEETLREIKEKLGYVAIDLDAEIEDAECVTYELPDARKIQLGDARFKCPEALYRPNIMTGTSTVIDDDSVQDIILQAIQSCDADLRRDMYDEVVCSGGSTLFPGSVERLRNELKEKNASVHSMNDRDTNAAWIGGSILSALGSFDSMWITKAEYEEAGAAVIHRKCF